MWRPGAAPAAGGGAALCAAAAGDRVAGVPAVGLQEPRPAGGQTAAAGQVSNASQAPCNVIYLDKISSQK